MTFLELGLGGLQQAREFHSGLREPSSESFCARMLAFPLFFSKCRFYTKMSFLIFLTCSIHLVLLIGTKKCMCLVNSFTLLLCPTYRKSFFLRLVCVFSKNILTDVAFFRQKEYVDLSSACFCRPPYGEIVRSGYFKSVTNPFH